MMRYSGITDVGRVREHNEDAWRVAKLEAGQDLFVVSDGVGGHASGEVASKIVAETLSVLLDERISPNAETDALQTILKDCLTELNRIVVQHAQGASGVRGMAATVVCGLLSKNMLVVGHMGDSRCYLYRNNNLGQITKDHTVVQMLLDLGEITSDQAFGHPSSGRITQAIGMEQDPLPGIAVVELQRGDRLVFCSDGLHGMIDPEAITALLASGRKPEIAGMNLVRAALEAGGRDNVTVIVADIDIEDGDV